MSIKDLAEDIIDSTKEYLEIIKEKEINSLISYKVRKCNNKKKHKHKKASNHIKH